MPMTIQLVHAQEFLKGTVEGRIDLEKSLDMLRELARVPDRPDSDIFFLDLRGADVDLSPTDIYRLSSTIGETGIMHADKLVVLVDPTEFEELTFLETTSFNQGYRVFVFKDFEQSILKLWEFERGSANDGPDRSRPAG